jgi:hypothetical protein
MKAINTPSKRPTNEMPSKTKAVNTKIKPKYGELPIDATRE